MSDTLTHSIGDEIPYRRSTLDQRTGSLVFDKHLDAKLGEAPGPTARHDTADQPIKAETK